ncbi:MAG: DUF721 domain-containing protein [Chlamydiales bacterium]
MRSRTPRNYFGTQNPVKKMAELLPEMLSDLGRKAQDPKEEIYRFWHELIGEKMAPFTEPVSFRDGVLTVKVKSSTLYSLLVAHERPRLLARLQEKFSIRNLVFRVG